MDDLVVIKTFNTREEAEVVKGFLDSNGIKAFLLTDDASGSYSNLTLVHGIRLMVNTKDKEKAIKALKSI